MSEETATPRAESCFIVATRNRRDFLVEAVRSLVGQTVLPAELCVVDSSDEAPDRGEIERLCAAAGIRLDYVYPAPRGLTIQRNIGIDRTSTRRSSPSTSAGARSSAACGESRFTLRARAG
jgi:hypothetical protein